MANGKKHVRVVGAGPAGLMAAEVLSGGGASVTIIDHHANPGRKFLLAGRGGLNLTHSEDLSTFVRRYGEAREFLVPFVEAFPPSAVRAWCEGLGIKTFVGSSGRVFPSCMKASPVLRAWLRRLAEQGVKLSSKTQWQGFDDVPTILALGGSSWPELGSDGRWQTVFEHAGISVTPLRASNSRQKVAWSDHFATRHAGQPIKNVAISANGKSVRGELMIAHDGIEGGAIYALSSELAGGGLMTIDLKPDLTIEQVAQRLSKPRGKETRSNYLRKAFNLGPIAIALMWEAGTENPKSVGIQTLGANDMDRAISTSGGIARHEVTSGLQLIKKPGVWIAGEMLDWDAPTGGYLLQACFSTAQAAAKDCLRHLNMT